MYISKIRIQNFKCIKDSTIALDPHFNLIIGKNNCGKSTIFEALRLWKLAFDKFLKARTNNKESSFKANHYFSFTINDLAFLRISEFKRLFHNDAKKNISIQITLEDNSNNQNIEIELPIIFTLTTEEQNLRFSLFENQSNVTTKRFEASKLISQMIQKPLGESFKNLMLITYINPIFQLAANEPCYTIGYIKQMLNQAQVANVLRNIINLYAPKDYKQKNTQIEEKKKDTNLCKIEKSLDHILNNDPNREPTITFTSGFKDSEDSSILIYAHNSVDKSKVELSQLGSGTINLLNILSVLSFGESEGIILNILLLDEPDSHLHSNHQIQLFKYLKKVSEDNNKQMFIITHNHELISCADKVIYIGNNQKKIQAINQDEYSKILEDIATDSDYYRIMVDKNKLSESLKNITKPTLYCEGSSDVNILNVAYKKLYNKELTALEIIDGNSAAHVSETLRAARKDIYTFGLFDSDKEGIQQYNGFNKYNIVKEYIDDNMQRLDYKKNNNTTKEETKIYAMKLPVPKFRSDSAEYFSDNTCIEYMFPDDILKKIGVTFEKKRGNNYETIADLNSAKPIIQKKVNSFSPEYFESFRPIFEAINKYVKIYD